MVYENINYDRYHRRDKAGFDLALTDSASTQVALFVWGRILESAST
jgi:hypothetical protein